MSERLSAEEKTQLLELYKDWVVSPDPDIAEELLDTWYPRMDAHITALEADLATAQAERQAAAALAKAVQEALDSPDAGYESDSCGWYYHPWAEWLHNALTAYRAASASERENGGAQ